MGARVPKRRRAGNAGILFAAMALLCGAAPDPDAAVRAAHAQDLRLLAVGDRLARGCAGLTGDVAVSRVNLPGLLIQDIAQYAPGDRAVAARVLHVGEGPTVVAVLPGKDGASAALAVGDRIISVDGTATDADVAHNAYARMTKFDTSVAAAGGGSVFFGVLRSNGTTFRARIMQPPGCAAFFQIVAGGFGKTQADGRYVQISQAMVDFATNDEELAAVTAHELAHTALRHAARKTPSKQAEYEADWLSVWLLARAGFDLDAVVPFWTRLGKRMDFGIFADGTHPGWKQRVAKFAQAVALAKAQRAAGQDLVPPPQQSTSQAENRR